MANQVVIAAGTGLLPALIWLWFWLKEDRRHPEPRSLLAFVFALGALAVIPAYLIERQLYQYFSFRLDDKTWLLAGVLIWAAVEEALKLLMVYFAAFHHRDYDEPVDAMVYMITAAIGFAALENTLFIWSAMQESSVGLAFLLTGNFRFLGATLVHIVSSAALGGMLGLAFYRNRANKLAYFIWGLILAIVLHAIFNYFIIISEAEHILRIFAVLWLAVVFIILFFERVKGIKGIK